MIETWTDALLAAQNPDGGWGAEKGKRSSTEATALAVLALDALDTSPLETPIERGLRWLTGRQAADGSWPLADGIDGGSWTTSLAVVSLARFEGHRQQAVRGAGWLLHEQGRGLGWLVSLLYRFWPESLVSRSNPDLKGWPWTTGTFSWVEPTAYALLAVKKLRTWLTPALADERIRQGELMIYDRMCAGGGWNYGSASALEVKLPPYPETTALALVALQERRATESNQMSLKVLEGLLQQAESGLTLAWSILCFSLYGLETSPWRRALERSYERTGFLGALKPLALALVASTGKPDAFRV